MPTQLKQQRFWGLFLALNFLLLTMTGCAVSNGNGTWAVGRFYPPRQWENPPGLLEELLDAEPSPSLQERYEQMAEPDSLNGEENPFQPKF